MRFPRNWKAALVGLSAAIGLGLVSGATPACAGQSDTGGMVAGRIFGPDGRGVAGAAVQLEATSGERSETASDLRGGFHFAAVAPGEYTLRVHTPDLSDYEADHLEVGLGTARRVNPRLAARWMHRTILVDARFVEAQVGEDAGADAGAGENASRALAGQVPDNSGQWSSEAAVLSGSGSDDGEDLSLRGLSPLMSSITVDGMNGKLAFRGRQRATEGNGFATVQSAVSAYRGNADELTASVRASSGAMSAVTKSGGNHMHGQAVLFDRGSFGQAANAFSKTLTLEPAETTANGQPVLYLNGQPMTYIEAPYHAPDRRQRWEVAAGGPIQRDRMWWYFAWEQYQRNDPAVARANEPELFFAAPSTQSLATLEARIATSRHPLLAACPGPAPESTARAECAWTNALNQLNGMLGKVPRQTRQTIVFPKLSWRVNARNQVVAQYNSMRRTGVHTALSGATEMDAIGSFGNSSTSDDTGIARWDWSATPRITSSARYQYNRDLLVHAPATGSAFEAQFANNAWGLPPEVTIDKSQGLSFGTLGTANKRKYPLETRQQLADGATWVHGREALRIGYDYNYVTDELEGLNGENGAYSYASLTDFLSDMLAPSSCDGTTTGTGPYPCYSRFRQTVGSTNWSFETADYAAYAANEWKLGQRLTLTLGARYEYEQVPDTNAALVNADIPETARLAHDRRGFGPRGGFALDVFGKGRTVLRGG
ncbi:MAG TPA: TonB-dependent receptor, partial [Acidobacteriaceae bacterium]|nr:TonB-dependent receptor [Acidobacteriaceae bacterium]